MAALLDLVLQGLAGEAVAAIWIEHLGAPPREEALCRPGRVAAR